MTIPDSKIYHSNFSWRFLLPKYWPTWLMIITSILLSFLPIKVKAWLTRALASKLVLLKKGSIQKARINLEKCFPDKSQTEREDILVNCLAVAGAAALIFPQIALRSFHWLRQQCDVEGFENFSKTYENNQNIILMASHSWVLEVPGFFVSSYGLKSCAFIKRQKNPVINWLINAQRRKYGGLLFERSDGIKPFVRAVKNAHIGYYLPDQDHGRDKSVFVDFLGTRKATLPGLYQLARLSNAQVMPIRSAYDPNTGRFKIVFSSAINDQLTGDDEKDARLVNQIIEQSIIDAPEQYMWILKILKTQEHTDEALY